MSPGCGRPAIVAAIPIYTSGAAAATSGRDQAYRSTCPTPHRQCSAFSRLSGVLSTSFTPLSLLNAILDAR
jgi:hypothetical protein